MSKNAKIFLIYLLSYSNISCIAEAKNPSAATSNRMSVLVGGTDNQSENAGVSCTDGTALASSRTQYDLKQWCEKTDGTAHGPFRAWYETGVKMMEARYEDGKLQGKIVRWHRNGQKEMDAQYVNGMIEGKVTIWEIGGHKVFEGDFKGNRFHGKYRSFHETGRKWKEGETRNGLNHGLWVEWIGKSNRKETIYKCGVELKYVDEEKLDNSCETSFEASPDVIKPCPDGTKRAGDVFPKSRFIHCKKPDGKLHGPFVLWDLYGVRDKTGEYINGKRHGKWILWSGGHEDTIQEYDKGIEHGNYIGWHLSGQKRYEASYNNGKKHGRVTEWYNNGRKKYEGDYREGLLDGIHRYWNEKGELLGSNKLKNGKGLWKNWYSNREKRIEGHYLDGKKQGLWKGWHQFSRTISFEENYKDGVLHGKRMEWYKNGGKKRQSSYHDGRPCGKETYWERDGSLSHERIHESCGVNEFQQDNP